MIKKLFISLLLLLCFNNLHASLERYNERIEGNSIIVGASLNLYDDKYFDIAMDPTWASQFKHKSVKNYVRLALNPGAVLSSNFSGSVTLKVSYEELVGNTFVSVANTEANSQKIRFSWDTQLGAEFYELEWVHINNYTLSETQLKATDELFYNSYRATSL